MAINTIGARTDGSWSQAMFEAYQELQQKYPDVTFTFSDLVPYNDFPAFLTKQAQEGVDLIYADSAWFDAVKVVAPQYPDTWFVMPELTEEHLKDLPDNVTTYFSKYEESGYLAGIAAGLTTKTNTLAAVLGQTGYPDLNCSAYAFFEGAKAVNPEVKFAVGVTGDWVDVQKGYDTTMAVIDAGADVVMHFTDNGGLGVIKAATERNVFVVGEARDQSSLAPNNVITSFIVPHAVMAERALTDLMDGTISKKVTVFGLAEGMPGIAPLTNVSEETKAKVEETKKAILDGSLKIVPRTDATALDDFLVKK